MVQSKLALDYCIDESMIYFLILIYAPFRIDIEQNIKTFLYISKDYHISRSELLQMPYYEYEIILEEINALQKEQEKQQEEQEKQHSAMMNNYNPSKMASNMSHSMPSMPKINMPKF